MKAQVLQENLSKAVTRVSRTISAKPQLPILQNILLSVVGNQLQLVATNLETTEIVWLGAKIESDGGICVPARIFSELISTLPHDNVVLEVDQGSLKVSCGRTRATIPGVSVSEYPPVPTADRSGGSVVDKDTFADAVSAVLFAAATDEGRPLLTGVRVKTAADETTIAATDGYRLSVKQVKLVSKEAFDMVVPAKALSEVVKVVHEDKTAGQLRIVPAGVGQLAFIAGDTDIITRLIDGDYPNYQKIIPTAHGTRATIDREVFTRAVKSAAIFARENANIIRLHVDKDGVSVSANTPQVGENHIDIEAVVEGDGGDIAFNSRFLLDFLANTSGGDVVFEMTGSLNPGLFRLGKDESFLHVIMPVRVQSA